MTPGITVALRAAPATRRCGRIPAAQSAFDLLFGKGITPRAAHRPAGPDIERRR